MHSHSQAVSETPRSQTDIQRNESRLTKVKGDHKHTKQNFKTEVIAETDLEKGVNGEAPSVETNLN